MLIYLLILCVLKLCGATQDRKYAPHAVTTYFKIFCLYARAEDDTTI